MIPGVRAVLQLLVRIGYHMVIDMKSKKLRAVLAVAVTVAILSVSLAVSSLAAAIIDITDEDKKAEYLDVFNEAANRIKSDCPAFDMYVTTNFDESNINKDAAKWLRLFVGVLFDSENDVFGSLMNNAFSEEDTHTSMLAFERGELNYKAVPVSGKDYVSALEDVSTFDCKYRYNSYDKTTTILFKFDDTTYGDSDVFESLCTVFNIPDSLALDFSSVADIKIDNPVFELDDITFSGAQVQIILDADGNVKAYRSDINYMLKFDMKKFLSTGIEKALLSAAGIQSSGSGAVSKILQLVKTIVETSGGSMDVLDNALGSIGGEFPYSVKVEMKDFDWSPRYYGDIDNDNDVDATDARAALRHAVALENISNGGNLKYADVDFDEKVTAADARLILRMAVLIDKLFTNPDGTNAYDKKSTGSASGNAAA